MFDLVVDVQKSRSHHSLIRLAASQGDPARLKVVRELLTAQFTEIEHISNIIKQFVAKFEEAGDQAVVQQFHALLQSPPTVEQIQQRRASASGGSGTANGSPGTPTAGGKRRPSNKKGSAPATPAAQPATPQSPASSTVPPTPNMTAAAQVPFFPPP